MLLGNRASQANDVERPRGRVLVVDDMEAVAAVFERVLTQAGFNVMRADNGERASQLLLREQFDAIVSDIGMPQMDGIALLRAVRDYDLDVPVLLITGQPAVDTALKAVEFGALRYLLKPIAPADLISQVEQAVRLGRMARLKREALALGSGDTSMQLGDRAGLEACFARALDQLWTAYQPIVSYPAREVVAFEALMRSNEPRLPHPGDILSAADRLDKLNVLGRCVRKHVGQTITGSDVPLVFVNLHPKDLTDKDLFAPDSELCKIASRVVLEITERASLDEVPDIKARVAQLRALGFRVAIDDVGAGYAGLNSIAQLEPEVMKIDMALVRDIDREPTKQKLVAAMTGLCREMNVLVVAEGVETPYERDMLAALGCDLMQGYLFARPGKPFPQAQF